MHINRVFFFLPSLFEYEAKQNNLLGFVSLLALTHKWLYQESLRFHVQLISEYWINICLPCIPPSICPFGQMLSPIR